MTLRTYTPSGIIPVPLTSRGSQPRDPDGPVSRAPSMPAHTRESVASQSRAANNSRKRRMSDTAAAAKLKSLPPIAVPTRQPYVRPSRARTDGPKAHVPEPRLGWPLTVQRHVDKLGSHGKLAKVLDVSTSTIGRWIEDKATPTGDRARWLAGEGDR